LDLNRSLDEALDSCAVTLPPDYFTFYERITQLLSSGIPPRSFGEIFASKLKTFDDLMKEYSARGERGEELSPRELEVFKGVSNKWKLLQGCIEKMPVAMRRLISELAGTRVMGLP
jgi:hypothetical protein